MVYKKFVLKRGWGRLKILKKGDDIGKEGAGFGKGGCLKKGEGGWDWDPLTSYGCSFRLSHVRSSGHTLKTKNKFRTKLLMLS